MNLPLRIWSEGIQKFYHKGNATIRMRDGYSPNGEVFWGTGRYDKHGKEIYRGDILKVAGLQIVVVVWDDQTAGFSTSPPISYAEWGWREAVTDHADQIEVIGNIKENPELIP